MERSGEVIPVGELKGKGDLFYRQGEKEPFTGTAVSQVGRKGAFHGNSGEPGREQKNRGGVLAGADARGVSELVFERADGGRGAF